MKPSDTGPELDEKVEEALATQGGAIRKPRKKKSPKKAPKVEEALAASMQGGAIKKPKKKSPKKEPKVEEALAASMQGGKLRFHDPMHKYLHGELSGRGGRLDTPFVRQKMHDLMSRYHPSILQSYLAGKVRDLPQDPHWDLGAPPQQTRPDPRPTFVDHGGSLNRLTHSENGILQAHDSRWHPQFELV